MEATGLNPLIPPQERTQNYFVTNLPSDVTREIGSYLKDMDLYALTNLPMPEDNRKVITQELRHKRAKDILSPLTDDDFYKLTDNERSFANYINYPTGYNPYLSQLTDEDKRMYNYQMKKQKARMRRYENLYDDLKNKMVLQPAPIGEFHRVKQPYAIKKVLAKSVIKQIENAQNRLNREPTYLQKFFGFN